MKGDTEFRILDRTVLAVAVEGSIGDWAAYIAAVAGNDHSEEWRDVASKGSKLNRAIAEVIFPEWAKRLEWRR